MSTKETVQSYFNGLNQKKGWESFLGENMVFTSFVSPIKQVTGKAAYIESTRRFFSMVVSVELRDLIIEGEKACVLSRYGLRPPKGDAFRCDVAEIFTVKNGMIDSLAIYFDTSPFPS